VGEAAANTTEWTTRTVRGFKIANEVRSEVAFSKQKRQRSRPGCGFQAPAPTRAS